MVRFRPLCTLGATVAAVSLWTAALPADGREPLVGRTVEVRPEYERTLKRVYFSIPDEYHGAREAAVDPHRHVAFVQHAYAELIAALPPYTRIDVAVSNTSDAALVERLRATAGPRPFQTHVIERLHADLDMWAQDLGERMLVDGDERFLVPMPIDPAVAYNGELSLWRRRVSQTLFGSNLLEADFVFEGGNLAFDRVDGRLRVFVGYNDVLLTIENYRRLGRRLDADAVKGLVSATFGGAEVVVVGREQQSPRLFHLDQAFMLLADNVAVVNRLVGPPTREQRQLEATRTALEGLGYRTIPIDHTQADIEGYRTSTNGVPFVDADTGEKKVIFPVFPGEVRGTPQGRLTLDHLTGKALAAFRAYEAAGYHPIPIRDFAHIVGGSTHCITNVVY
jgi:hypothetical protein